MINEKRLEEALKFLADTDEEDAKLGAGLEYLKDKQKRDKAIHIVSNSNEGSAIVEADNDLEAYNKFKSLSPTEINLKLNSLNKDRITYEVIKDVKPV